MPHWRSVPVPTLFSSHFGNPENPNVPSCSSWGHPGMRKMGVQSSGRVEPGSLKLWALRADSGQSASLHSPPFLSPCSSSSQMGQANRSQQAASVCFLPLAALALCLPNIRWGFAAFALALLTGAASGPKGKERPQLAEATTGPRLG